MWLGRRRLDRTERLHLGGGKYGIEESGGMHEPSKLDRLGAPASVAASILWLLVWLHQRVTHGATQVNEERLLLGLTWKDSAKFLVLPLLLLLLGMVSLFARRRNPGLLGRLGFTVTVLGLTGMIVGTAIEFWFFPWGS